VREIGELFKISKGRKVEQASIPTNIRYIQIEDLRDNKNYKFAIESSNNVLCTKRDIVLAWDGANAGTVGYGLIGAIGSTLVKLMPKLDDISTDYCGRYLQSKFDYFRSNCTGATIPHISKKSLLKLKIPFPSLTTQQKIANILDTTDVLRQKSKIIIKKYDELAQSLFLQMFAHLNGEKVSLSKACILNPKKSEILDLNKETIVSFIPMPAVSVMGKINLKIEKTIEQLWNGFTYFANDDVLFAKITPCMENGKGGIAKKLKNKIGFGSTEFHVLRPIKNVSSSTWLYYLTKLPLFRMTAENNMTGSAGQKRVPKSFFDKYKIIIPPIPLQTQFADRITQIDQQKQRAEQALQQSENLFNSLLQRAFKGKLTD